VKTKTKRKFIYLTKRYYIIMLNVEAKGEGGHGQKLRILFCGC
jgi:hypothetical protein